MMPLKLIQANRHTFLVIGVFTFSGLLLRIFLTDFDSMNSMGYDSRLYYEYASTIAFQGHYPESAVELHNIGWVMFLVPFFKVIGPNQENLIFAQHIISITVSTATIPLSYYFARKHTKFAVIVPLLFAVDYRMAQNAGFGITEPLFMVLALAALGAKNRAVMFVFVSLACTVRFEGIMLIPAILLIERKKSVLPFVLIPLAVLGLLFVANSMIGHDDQMVSKISHEIEFAKSPYQGMTPTPKYWTDALLNSVKYMVWAVFPTFCLSVLGMHKRTWLLPVLFILSLSGLWAYLDAYDTRYFFPMYPFLALGVAFFFESMKKFNITEDIE